jgi:hypothetical protein
MFDVPVAYFQYTCVTRSNVQTSSLHNAVWLTVELTLRPMVSQPIRLGVGHPFGTHDQIFLFLFFSRTIALLFVLGHPL